MKFEDDCFEVNDVLIPELKNQTKGKQAINLIFDAISS